MVLLESQIFRNEVEEAMLQELREELDQLLTSILIDVIRLKVFCLEQPK